MEILSRAAAGRSAVVVTSTTEDASKSWKLNQVRLHAVASKNRLLEAVHTYLEHFWRDGGILLFLYSLLLSRGLDRVRQDMDPAPGSESHLIGQDEFGSQEIVNLALTGRATSNVFNGELEIDTGGEEPSFFRGVSRPSPVGFLSPEADVGPVWVVFGS